MLVDYKFYTDVYLGDKLTDEKTFNKYINKASIYLNSIISQPLPNNQQVKMCLCEIAEQYADNVVTESTSNIASEKVGDWSVTYKRDTTNSTTNLNSKLYEIAKLYLGKTGILYRGYVYTKNHYC